MLVGFLVFNEFSWILSSLFGIYLSSFEFPTFIYIWNQFLFPISFMGQISLSHSRFSLFSLAPPTRLLPRSLSPLWTLPCRRSRCPCHARHWGYKSPSRRRLPYPSHLRRRFLVCRRSRSSSLSPAPYPVLPFSVVFAPRDVSPASSWLHRPAPSFASIH